MERAWRGLWLAVKRTSFEENIQIEVLSCSREELLADFERADVVERSGLYAIV